MSARERPSGLYAPPLGPVRKVTVCDSLVDAFVEPQATAARKTAPSHASTASWTTRLVTTTPTCLLWQFEAGLDVSDATAVNSLVPVRQPCRNQDDVADADRTAHATLNGVALRAGAADHGAAGDEGAAALQDVMNLRPAFMCAAALRLRAPYVSATAGPPVGAPTSNRVSRYVIEPWMSLYQCGVCGGTRITSPFVTCH